MNTLTQQGLVLRVDFIQFLLGRNENAHGTNKDESEDDGGQIQEGNRNILTDLLRIVDSLELA